MLTFPVLFSVACRYPPYAMIIGGLLIGLSLFTPVFGAVQADRLNAVGMSLLILTAVLETARDFRRHERPYLAYLVFCCFMVAGGLWHTFTT